jgi:hypothetical protein
MERMPASTVTSQRSFISSAGQSTGDITSGNFRGDRIMHNPTSWREMLGALREGQHIGQVYRDDGHLVDAACHYIVEGLRRGEAVIVVVTAAHWAAFVGRLATARGIDVVDAVMKGQLRYVDVDVALSSLMVDETPNRQRFFETSGSMIEGARKRFGAVRIFGEMSHILWQKGNRAAATRLEEFWKGLAASFPFALLYPCHNSGGDVQGDNAAPGSRSDTHSQAAVADNNADSYNR